MAKANSALGIKDPVITVDQRRVARGDKASGKQAWARAQIRNAVEGLQREKAEAGCLNPAKNDGIRGEEQDVALAIVAAADQFQVRESCTRTQTPERKMPPLDPKEEAIVAASRAA